MKPRDLNKVKRIYKTSLRLISKNGIAGLTMSKIAKESSIATGTLYIYFKNKEELINSLYRKIEKESLDRFLQGYDSKEPFKIGLKKIWVNYLKHRVEYHEESVFMEQYYRSPYISDNLKRLTEEMKEPVYNVIRRGKREMLIKNNIDDEMIFLAMLGFIRELADEHVNNIYELTPKRIDDAFNLSWDMIKM